MSIVDMRCPRCGKQATEYDKNKWRCLSCNAKFIYEEPAQHSIVEHIHRIAFNEQAEAKTKWYFATYWFVIALMCVGPFALPLLWFNPRYKLITKIIVSAVIIAISIWFYIQLKAAWEMAQKQLGGLHSGY